jgi:hypothetical protein
MLHEDVLVHIYPDPPLRHFPAHPQPSARPRPSAHPQPSAHPRPSARPRPLAHPRLSAVSPTSLASPIPPMLASLILWLCQSSAVFSSIPKFDGERLRKGSVKRSRKEDKCLPLRDDGGGQVWELSSRGTSWSVAVLLATSSRQLAS